MTMHIAIGRSSTTNRFFPDKRIPNARVARPVSGRIFVWLALIAVSGTLISAGFVISARQHIQAVSVGYKSEQMRREALQLDERLHQLELEYSQVTSPFEIARRAEKIGLDRPNPTGLHIRRPANSR